MSDLQIYGFAIGEEGSNGFTLVPFMVDGEKNPALKWRWSCGEEPGGTFCEAASPHNPTRPLDCRWVAVGVKETSE